MTTKKKTKKMKKMKMKKMKKRRRRRRIEGGDHCRRRWSKQRWVFDYTYLSVLHAVGFYSSQSPHIHTLSCPFLPLLHSSSLLLLCSDPAIFLPNSTKAHYDINSK
jgi:hypothetical protein